MSYFLRFGKRMPIPSSLQVLHELRSLSNDEDARMRCAEEGGLPGTAGWDEIVTHRQMAAAAKH